MKVSGFAAVAVLVAGAALMPSTASAAVFTLNECTGNACANFTGSVMITITDNGLNDVDFKVENNSNGVIDYLRFGYAPTPPASANVTEFKTIKGSRVKDASFITGTAAGIGYNVGFDFKSGEGNQFDDGSAVSFTLQSNNFNFDATGFSSALARVVELSIGGQAVTLTNGGSEGGGKETVPEPASIALFGFAALAAGRRMRRRNVK